MRFFLVGRDRSSGTVRLVSEESYPSREDALDALQTALPSDGSMDAADLFVVDLDAVTPVVMMRASSSAASVDAGMDEPPADADHGESAEDIAFMDMPTDVPTDLLEPVEDEGPAAATGGLADALRRAAAQMEDEGITAAPQVEELAAMAVEAGKASSEQGEAVSADEAAEDEPADASDPEATEVAESDPVETVAEDQGAIEDRAVAAARVAPEVVAAASAPPEEPMSQRPATGSEWPWENAVLPGEETPDEDAVATDEVELETAGPEEVVAESAESEGEATQDEASAEEEPEAAPIEETPGEETPVDGEHFAPDGIEEPSADDVPLLAEGDEFAGRPVIMGDYADSAEPSAADEATAEQAGVDADAELGDLVAALDDIAPTGASGDGAAAEAAPGYEPDAKSLDEYTCDDCVYVGTCPKHHKDSPSSCGSFQWKS